MKCKSKVVISGLSQVKISAFHQGGEINDKDKQEIYHEPKRNRPFSHHPASDFQAAYLSSGRSTASFNDPSSQKLTTSIQAIRRRRTRFKTARTA